MGASELLSVSACSQFTSTYPTTHPRLVHFTRPRDRDIIYTELVKLIISQTIYTHAFKLMKFRLKQNLKF